LETQNSKELAGAILVADLSGYTAATEAHGSYSAAKIVTHYGDLVRQSLEKGCRILDQVGDEVLIFSEDTVQIVQTAINVLNAVNAEENFLDVHIGLHFGDLLEYENRVFGATINVASRIASHAKGGQLLCSESIKNKLKTQAPDLIDLGSIKFKNVKRPIRVYEITTREEVPEKVSDPVCQMKVDPKNATAFLTHDGLKYFFCSETCLRSFLDDPNEYLR